MIGRTLFFLGAFWSSSALAATQTPPEVAAIESGIGIQFTTADGHTLYVYDKDVVRDESTCMAKCAEAWPPLTAPSLAMPVGEWTIVARPDGVRQWSLRGKPVYAFAQDTHPGATLGESVQDIWHLALALAPRPLDVSFQGTIQGRVAATAKGHTLYTPDRDCTDDCLQTWKPLAAPWAANSIGDWAVVVRKDDGTKQWAYRGKAVYSNVNDTRPGDMHGDGREGVWHAVVLQPMPPIPAGITVRPSDYGPIFANLQGMTLYAIGNDMSEVKRVFCDDACFKENWTPVFASAGTKTSGNWGLIAIPEGQQWTYRGQPVFTYNHDKAPSDINGDHFAVGNGFGGFHVLPQKSIIEETL